MADTFRLDFVGTKAGIKGASVVMGYLETGMRVLDSASGLLSRLQELAVLGANDTNTTADHEAINLEAEAIADEFNRLMTTSTYKGRNIFVDTASSLYVSMGGRDQEMSFGVGTIDYKAVYSADPGRKVMGGPNDTQSFNLTHLPSDAVATKSFGSTTAAEVDTTPNAGITKDGVLEAGKQYIVTKVSATDKDTTATAGDDATHAQARDLFQEAKDKDGAALAGDVVAGQTIVTINADADLTVVNADYEFKELSTTSATLKKGRTYVMTAINGSGKDATDIQLTATAGDATSHVNALALAAAATKADGTALSGNLAAGVVVKIKDTADFVFTDHNYQFKEVTLDGFDAESTFEIMSMGTSDGKVATASSDAKAIADATTIDADFVKGATFKIDVTDADQLAKLNALTQGMTFRRVSGSDILTKDIEAVQGLVNTARVQAGSQYAALESAVNYTTDLTAQYELGYNTVNDVNFSMETAHLAKNQILQQAATAMLAQANSGQQGLLQLIS
jgi:flagellin